MRKFLPCILVSLWILSLPLASQGATTLYFRDDGTFDDLDPIDTLTTAFPTSTVLLDYDASGSPGIRIQKFLDFSNPKKFHIWAWQNPGPDIDMSGDVFVNFFTRTVGSDVGEKGAVMVALESDSGGVPNPLGSPVMVFEEPWPGTWQMRTAEIDVVAGTLKTGHTLRVIFWVDAASGASIHFAYDTVQQPSHLVFGNAKVLSIEGDATDVPPAVRPGTSFVEALEFYAQANPPPVILDSLEIVRIGSATDADIDSVRLWLDNPVSDDGDLIPANDILLATTVYSGGVARFTNLNHSINQRVFFISNDVSSSAQPGRTFGVVIQEPSHVWSNADVVVSDGIGWPQPDTTAVTTIVSPADSFSILAVHTPYDAVTLGQSQIDVSVVVFNDGSDDLQITGGGLTFTLGAPNDRAGDYFVAPALGNADTLLAATADTLSYLVDVLGTALVDSTIVIDAWYDVQNLSGTWTASRTGAWTNDSWTVIDSASQATLIDSSGTLYPGSTYAGDPSLTLHVGINNPSATGVMLSTTSTIAFSDSVQTFQALLANPTYIPTGAKNFTITFSPGAVSQNIVAPASYDLLMTLTGIDDFGASYADTILTTGRNSLFVNTPQIRVTTNDLDVETVLPGANNRAILSLEFENGYNSDQYLDTLRVTNMSVGPGTPAQLDSEMRTAYLVDDVDSTGTLTVSDTVVSATVLGGGEAVFDVAGAWRLPAMARRSLIVTVDVDSSLARDGDILNATLSSPGDVLFQGNALIANDFSPLYPLDSFGRLVIDGMASHQVALSATGPDTLFSGSTGVPLIRLQVPQNGYEADTLSSLSISNAAPDFSTSDISALRLYRDTGDGLFDAATDLLVGTLVYSGDRYQITGLGEPVSPQATLFVTADIPLNPTSGNHFQPGLRTMAIEMKSGNDGPLDLAVWSPKIYVLRKVDKIDISEVPLAALTPYPGERDIPMLHIQIDNNTQRVVRLDTLKLDNTSFGTGSLAELDNVFATLRLYIDNGDGEVGAGDNLVRDNLIFSNGAFSAGGLDIAFGVNQSRQLLITADIDSVCVRDGDSLRVAISSQGALQFDQPALKSVALPIETSPARPPDGMVAHQIAVFPTADSLVINFGNDILVFDFGLPANGYEADTLHSIELQNLGSATSEHIGRLALYVDGGNGVFEAGAGDDAYLGDVVENTAKVGGRFYMLGGLSVPLEQACGDHTRFFVAADILDDFTVGGSIQFSIPILGVDCASQNDGPIDVAARNPSILVIPKPDQLTVFPYSVGDVTTVPGSERNLNFGIGFYNGYSFPLTLSKLKIFQEGSASSAEIDSIHVYADVDTNGLFDPASDQLVESIEAVAAAQTISGLDIDLEPKRISYVYVVYDLPLAVTDSVTVDFKMFDPEDFSVLPKSAVIQGEFPINSPGVDVVDGMVAAQVGVTPVPQFRAAPNDSNVLAMTLDIPANGLWPDILDRIRIQNLGTAVAVDDIIGLRLWEEAGGDPGSFDPFLDVPLGALTWDGAAWTNAVIFDRTIPLSGLRVYLTFSVGPLPSDGVTFQASVPLNGITVRSGNDGPIDQALTNDALQTVSTDPLISSLAVDQSRYNVGQTVTLTMNLRNEATDTLYAVVPSTLVISGTGGVTLLSGPSPAQVDLPPASTADLVWTYAASATGEVDFCGFAHTVDSVTVSKATCSGTFGIQSRADSIGVHLTSFAPATANRGQDNVSMFRLSMNYASFDSAAAPVAFDGITLRVENDAGVPVPPNSLLDRIALVGTDGSNNLFSLVDSTSNPLQLLVATPLVVDPGDSLTLFADVDIATAASFTPFRLAIASLGDVTITDVNDGGPVPLANSQGFPWTTTTLFVNEPAESLLVDADTNTTVYANSGQELVTMFVLRAQNPAGPNSASEIVTDLTLSFFDTTGAPLVPADVIKRIILKSGAQTLFTDENIPVASQDINARLSTPLVVPAGSDETVHVLVDVRSIPAADAFYFEISTPTSIVARDINTEQLVTVAAQNPALRDFPLQSHTLVFQSAATGLVVSATDRLPLSILPSAQNVAVLDLVLTHPDTAASSLMLDSLAVEFVGTAGVSVFPGDFFGALGVVHNSDTLSLVTSLSSTNPFVECLFNEPLRLAPASSETLSIWVDAKALFSPTTLEVRIAQSHLRVLDANDGTRIFGITGPFPFVAGPTSMQLPSDEVACGVLSLAPRNVAKQSPGMDAIDLLVQNNNAPGSTPIAVDSIAVEVQDLQGSRLDPNDLFSAASMRRGGTLLASGQMTAAGMVFALPDSAVLVAASDTDTVRLTVDVDAQVDNVTFRFAIRAAPSIVARDVATNNTVPATVIGGGEFPLVNNSTHILAPTADAAFTNYPNPFSPGVEATNITYYVPTPAHVTLKLYTIWGHPVLTLVDKSNVPAGLHQDVSWDGRNGDGDLVNNGVYYLVLELRESNGKTTRIQRKIGVIR